MRKAGSELGRTATVGPMTGMWAAAMALLAVVATTAIFASPASAFETRPFITSVRTPLPVAHTVAVDQVLDRIWVTSNPSSNEGGYVYAYHPDGTRDQSVPTLSSGEYQIHPYAVAVDNSGGLHQSYIYVAENDGSYKGVRSKIQQYTPAGVPAAAITQAAVPPDGTPQGGGLRPVFNPPEATLSSYALAVDQEGNIYAVENRGEADTNPKAIDKFAPDGTFIAQLAQGEISGTVEGIAVDASGNIYLADYVQGLIERDAQGNCVDSCNPIDPTAAESVAIDPSSGNIVVGQTLVYPEGRIREYNSAHKVVSSFGTEELGKPTGVAVLDSNGEAYLVDGFPNFENTLKIFGTRIVLPDVTTEPATNVTSGSAVFHGQVGAAGVAGATCAFQYTTQEQFEADRFADASSVPCEPEGPFAGEAMNPVEAEPQDLSGGTLYHYRLLGTNASGSNPGEDITFTTPGPHIGSESVGAVTETSAELRGSINPRGETTTYQFEYVGKAGFEASGFAGAIKVPAAPQSIGAGNEEVAVAQSAVGLIPGALYEFRLTAVNASGVSHARAKEFQPYPAGVGLPDGRVYEQVTPVAKNGNNVFGYSGLLKAAPGGGAATYFLTSGDPASEGGQEFPTAVASRGAENWHPSSILPPSTYGERINVIGWAKDPRFSFPVLWNSGTKGTFYLRDNVSGAMTVIAAGVESEFGAYAADESDGLAQVYFESTAKLLPEAMESHRDGPQNLYVWDRATGSLHLVSVLPDGSTAPEGAIAGAYQWFGDIRDEGGARRYNYTQDQNVISADGSRAFFTTPGDDQIYVRMNPTSAAATTVEVSASQKTNGTGPGGTDPNGPQQSAFMTATPDGRYAFFTSFGELTNDAHTGAEGNDLYRFDTDSRELIDIAPDPLQGNGAEVQGVIGTSDDGSYVYFVANGVLAPGATQGNCGFGPRESAGAGTARCNIYVWHDGQIDYISPIGSNPDHDGLNWIATIVQGNVKPMKPSRVSPDGRTLLYFSNQRLTSYDSEGKTEVYRYRYNPAGGSFGCVSCNPSGQAPVGEVKLQSIEPGFTKPRPPQTPQQSHNMSASGDQVFFETEDKLVAGDINGVMDVYEWEADGAGSCRSEVQNGGCLYLISTGTSPTASYFDDASASGEDVYFFTNSSLVSQDTDELRDVYDARVGGGLAAQNPTPAVPCEGEACRGPALTPSAPAAAGTANFSGPGNPAQPKPKKPKKHRHHKRHKHHRHHKKGKKAKHKKKAKKKVKKSGRNRAKKGKH